MGKEKMIGWILVFLAVFGFAGDGLCTIDLNVQRTLEVDGTPIDVAVTLSGRSIYVLTNRGEILIYSPNGKLRDKVLVSKTVSAISVGQREEILFLTDRTKSTIEVVTLDLVKDINVTGSPFKGAENGPVVIAVFSDFQ